MPDDTTGMLAFFTSYSVSGACFYNIIEVDTILPSGPF